MNHDYDRIAKFYDLAAGRSLRAVREELAELALESGAERVLDIGCGTGLMLRELAERGLRATGIDNSQAMLAVAEKRLQELGSEQAGRAEIVLGSADELEAPGSFDLAVLSLLLHETESEPFLLLDQALLAAPRLFILDWCLAERNLDYPARLLVRLVERLAGSRHYSAYKSYMRQGALEGLMQRYVIYRRSKGLAEPQITRRRHFAMNTLLFMEVQFQLC